MTTTRRTLGPDGVWREKLTRRNLMCMGALVPGGPMVFMPIDPATAPSANAVIRGLAYPIDRAARLAASQEDRMTTTVMITTIRDDGTPFGFEIAVGDVAQAKVLRKFNVTADAKVDSTKVLCAALIQQMLDLQVASKAEADPHKGGAIARTAAMAISDLEKVQMLCVKANFAEA